MTTADTLLMQTGSDVVRLLEHGPRADCRQLAYCAIALSGEASADLNMATLTSEASRDEFDAVLAAIRAKGVDAILLVTEGAEIVRGWALEAGLLDVGQAPYMAHEAAITSRAAGPIATRIADPSEARVAMQLAASAFQLDEAACVDAMPAAFARADGNDLWLALDGDEPVGCGVFIRTGDHVGIYTMATPPAHQRRGIGAAILTDAMAHYRADGVTRFTLIATEKGYPLYAKLGFEVVSQPHAFVAGASTQFPGG